MSTIDKLDSDRPVSRDHPLLEPIRGLTILDVDTHLTEPADLWTSRATGKYKDLVPRVEYLKTSELRGVLGWVPDKADDDLSPVWIVEDRIPLGYAGGASTVNRAGDKMRGSDWVHWPLTDVSPAASLVEPRLQLMDEMGIWGQILYPNAIGFGGQAMARIQDPALRLLVVQMWNDVMAEHQEESGGRLMGMGIIPWWDTQIAVREVERIHSLGLRGVNTNVDPQNQGLPHLSDSFYTPMWEACEGFGLPVNFHIGASVSQESYTGNAPWSVLDQDSKMALGSALLYMSNARVMANLIFSGLLDRHPTLNFVSVESGVGWIPFILEALDYQVHECNVNHLSMLPSEYFKRQMYSCFWFEDQKGLMDSVEKLGVDRCMFETDFPHPTCLYPQPLGGIARTFEDQNVAWDVRAKLLGGNAASVYKVELPPMSV